MALADYLPANPESRVARELARACRRYLHRFNGFSYDFVEGGEQNVMQMLQPLGFKVILDVGANTGQWTRLALSYFPSAVFHTFEISKTTYPILQENLKGAAFRNNNLGLSSEKGTITYKDYGPASGLNTLISSASVFDNCLSHERCTAEVVTGDAYCDEHSIPRVDFLKVDVEGAEHLVFAGFQNMLKRKALRVIQFEYGYNNGDAGYLMRDFFRFFGEHGFVVAKIRKRGIQFSDFVHTMNNFESGPNYLAVRSDDTQVMRALTS